MVPDLGPLPSWMDSVGLGHGPLEDIEPLAGGTQNILIRFRRAGREYVLRRPPLHKRENSDETMRREARVLSALAGTDVPHPGLIALCADARVLGASFYLMEPVEGFNPCTELPGRCRTEPAIQRRMAFSMVENLCHLGDLDIDVLGIGDLGRRDGWLGRQVGRWERQLASYREIAGYPGPCLPGLDEVASWLRTNVPATFHPGLIHGDFQFSNVLLHPCDGTVAAIVDWELATIADPLLDFGHLLATWPTARPDSRAVVMDVPDLPGVDDLIAHYAEISDRDISDLLWFRVLACFRLGIILEGSHARAHGGMAPSEVGDRLHGITVRLFAQAESLVR